MPVDALAATLSDLPVRRDEPLARKTWWRVGGPADLFLEVERRADLVRAVVAAHRLGVPVTVLGNASNLLVSDRGIRGLVLRLGGELQQAEAVGDHLVLGGGAKLVQTLKRAEREGWTGIQAFAGIPGTVGGAVVMNAGAKLGETRDHLVDVEVLLPDGAFGTLTLADLRMSYRHAELPPGAIVVSARFARTGEDPAAVYAEVRAHLDHRARTQPIDVPTCGSTFRNPPGDAAGRLVEACGLKGHRIGGAQVSEKHANFLVNTGSATAADLRALIAHVRATVHDRTGIALVPEVIEVGERP